MVAIAHDLFSLFQRWHTWTLMANQDIALRYRRSLIGPFWISIAMATTVLSIGLLYSEVMNQPFNEFITWFGCGLIAWSLLSSMIIEGCGMVTENEGNLRSVPLPLPILAARVVYRNFMIFCHNAVVIVAVLAVFGEPLQVIALLSAAALLVYLPLGWFLAIALGPICARYRDLAQVVSSILQITFFLTPIFWVPHSNLSRPILVEANPFHHLLQLLRAPLLGEYPTLLNWQVSLGSVSVLGMLALASLSLTRRRVYLWL